MNKKPIYLLDWDCVNPKEELEEDFEIKLEDDINILVAYYSYENYSGEAIVIFEQKGKLYEVEGSHCSCYGLEGQWSPEEITQEYLNHDNISIDFGLSVRKKEYSIKQMHRIINALVERYVNAR